MKLWARSVLGVVGVALAATTVVAAGAAAEVDKPAEGTGDVYEDPGGGVENVPSTESRNVDLTRHVVRHSKKVVIESRFADLEKPPKGESVSVLTTFKVEGTGDVIFLSTSARHAYPDGKTLLKRRGSTVACKGLRATFDYNDDTITAIVPRSCLDTPRWLRYRSFSHRYIPAGSQYLFDSAGTSSTSYDDFGYSSKLRQG